MPNKEYIKKVKQDLGYLRQWFEGFGAGGGKRPSFEDGLRKAQILIEDVLADLERRSNFNTGQFSPGTRVTDNSGKTVGTVVASYKILNSGNSLERIWVLWDGTDFPITQNASGFKEVSDG